MISTALRSYQGRYWLLLFAVMTVTPAFADDQTVEVSIPAGASAPGCEKTNECYIPSQVTIDVGSEVVWSNDDSASHTVTSGDPKNGPDGNIDSSLFLAGQTFSHKFEEAGKFSYFCQVHPWMRGTIVVGTSDVDNTEPAITIATELPLYEPGDRVNFSGFINNLSDDRSTTVTIRVVGPIIDRSGSTNIMMVKQVLPNSDGSYSDSFFVGGPLWTTKGDYKIIASYGLQKTETGFFYNGGEEQPTAPPPVKCNEGQVIVNNQCVTLESSENSEPVYPRTISIPRGAAMPACSDTKSCYSPYEVTVPVGATVTWINDDSAGHFVTSGKDATADGRFDSGMIMPGRTFSMTFEEEGRYDYFCIVHPWMTGMVIAQEAYGDEYDHGERDPITVFTDKDSYNNRDIVTIYGKVGERLSGYDVTLQLFAPSGDLVTAQQLPVADDNTFNIKLGTGGPLWRFAGTYTVKVLYGTATRAAQTTFEFSGSGNVITNEGVFPLSSPYAGSVSYSIKGGKILSITPDPQAVSLIVGIETSSNGELRLILPRSVIDARTGTDGQSGEDDSFFILVDGEEVNFEEVESTDEDRTLSIPFEDGADQIEIFGTSILESSENSEPVYSRIISIPEGASTPGCELGDVCYDPAKIAVNAGTTVTWTNDDTAGHTVTSGTPSGGPNGIFDSSIIAAGSTFEHTFEEEGSYDYFCIVHPWMRGIVFIGQDYPQPEPSPSPEIELYTSTDKSDYDLGEFVTLNVRVFGIFQSQNVAVTITDPFGSIMISRTLTTDSNGNASTTFKIAESFKTGTYRVDAATAVNGGTYSDATAFKVTSQFNQIQIVSAQGTDQQGNPAQFTRGDMGFVKVQLNAQKSIATLITVNVFDSELTPIGVGSLKTTLSPGTSELILSFSIPNDAVSGTADIYVNALSDWVSAGGIPQTGEFSSQVRIN